MKLLKEVTDQLYKKYILDLDYVILSVSDYQGGASIILCKWFLPTVDCF